MKYYPFKWSYKNAPGSKNNFEIALKRIGELDPYNIKRTSLIVNHKTKYNPEDMKPRQLQNRGILNVRKRLNGHLGKSGKYTNRMIRLTATVKNIKNADNELKIKVPKKDYIKIAMVTYLMLWECDQELCKILLNKTIEDHLPSGDKNKQISMKTVVPVQTNIIIQSEGRTDDIQEFIKYVTIMVGKEG